MTAITRAGVRRPVRLVALWLAGVVALSVIGLPLSMKLNPPQLGRSGSAAVAADLAVQRPRAGLGGVAALGPLAVIMLSLANTRLFVPNSVLSRFDRLVRSIVRPPMRAVIRPATPPGALDLAAAASAPRAAGGSPIGSSGICPSSTSRGSPMSAPATSWRRARPRCGD
jgi:hypothetical protein